MTKHRNLWLATAAALIAVLFAPALAHAGPIGELAGQIPVVGPIVDPDSDGNADLPVLNEDTCPGYDDSIDQDSDGVPDACDADRDGDAVDNDDDLWPDDSVRSLPAHATTAYLAEFRAGNGASNQAKELLVREGASAADQQHAWTSGVPSSFEVTWSPSTSTLSLTVGSDTVTRTVVSVEDIRAITLQLKADGSRNASVSDLNVDGQALSPESLSVTEGTISHAFGSTSWGSGFTLAGTVTFTTGSTFTTNDLQLTAALGY